MNIYSENFNPEEIILNFTIPIAGLNSTTYSVTFGTLDSYSVDSMRMCTVYGAALGSCLTLALLSWIVIKRKITPIFILNQAILITMAIRCILNLEYLMGPLSAMGFSFTGIVRQDRYDSFQVTVAANAFQVILITLIEMSMCYQIFVIFQSPEVRILGQILTFIACMMGIAISGLYINSAILSTRYYHEIFTNGSTTFRLGVNNIPFILFSASILVMSTLLIAKLIFAIRTRRYLGLRQFDTYHILLIMSSQTMIIPTILVIINYCVSSQQGNLLSICSIVLVVLSLPFSSMWAAAANNSPTPNSTSLALLTRTNSNYSDSKTLSDSSYAFFPTILTKVASAGTDFEKTTLHSMPKIEETTINEPFSAETCFERSSSSFKFKLVDESDELGTPNSNEVLGYSSSEESVDRALANVRSNEFSVVKSHKFKY